MPAGSLAQLREQVTTENESLKKKQYEAGPKGSQGYGGQFGVEKDNMDKVRLLGNPVFP